MRGNVRYWKRGILALAGVLLGLAARGDLLVAGFEDQVLAGDWVETYAGSGGGVYYNGANGSGGFTSNGVDFSNSYTDWGGGYYSWSGWAYSTTTDVETAGYDNQYSAYAGAAAEGSVYAVTYAPSVLDLPAGWRAPVSLEVTNSSYAAISMREGDDFAKKFGDGDWFMLTLTGMDSDGGSLGSVEVYLADFRDGLTSGYILDNWTMVDLTALGTDVAQISFSLESTDNGTFGMNTPAYVAIDNLVLAPTQIPEPSAWALVLGLAGLILVWRRRA